MKAAPEPRRPAGRWRRLLPLALLGLGLALFLGSGAGRYLSLEALRQHRVELQAWVAAHAAAALLLHFLAYVAVVACSLPGATLMTLAAGFLFGTWLGGGLAALAATTGATLLFLAARSAFAGLLRARAGSAVARMEAGFHENALSYLLVLRLVPLFPFMLVNLAPAFLGVRLSTFVLATGIGILPGTFVYAGIGNGLDAVLRAGGTPDLAVLYRPEVLGPLVALAALSCLPILYKRLRRRRGTAE